MQIRVLFLSLLLLRASPASSVLPDCEVRFASLSITKSILQKLEVAFEQVQSYFGVEEKTLVSELSHDEDLKWVSGYFAEDTVGIAINQPSDARELIIESGIKNQFETGKSSAIMDPISRERTESKLLGISEEAYKSIDPKDRAKYGYVAPPPGASLARDSATNGYGKDTYYLKKDRFANRLTWLPGDSRDNAFSESRARRTSLIQTRFIPWSKRKLMLAFLKPAQEDTEVPQELKITAPTEWTQKTDQGTKYYRDVSVEQSYIEVQVWGQITLDDIEAFVFRGDPPTGNFLAALKAKKIPIFRNVNGRDVHWIEP